ncbi:unnamed protein product [Sphagnum troendelagicum]
MRKKKRYFVLVPHNEKKQSVAFKILLSTELGATLHFQDFCCTGFQCRSSQQICRDRERNSFSVDPVSEMRTRRFCALEGIEIWQQRTLGASDDASD